MKTNMTKAEYSYNRLKATSAGMNVLSCMCFFISAAFTIMLMWDSAAVPLKQVLSVIMAICLELAKVYFFRFIGDQAAEAERGGNIPGKYALYALTVLLFVASTFGSIHYYMKTEAEKSAQDKVKDSSYSAMNNDVTSIDAQISQLLELAKNQQAKHYITASKNTLAQVEALRKQKGQAVKDVSGYKAVDTSDSFYGLIAKFFGCEQDSAKGGMYLFLSILLEFCGIASAFYGSYSKAKLMDIEIAGMPDGDYRPDYGIRSADGNFYINPRGVAAPAFAQREPEPPKPERKVGFIPTGSASDDIAESLERIRAGLKQKSATGSGYSNKAAKADAIKVELPVIGDALVHSTEIRKPLRVKGSDSSVHSTSTTRARSTVDDKPLSGKGSDKIDADTLQAYIRTLFSKPKKDTSLVGRRNIADKLKISNEIADKIHILLKKKGFIRIEGNKTYPLMPEDEMLVKV
jgi:hypothetical protein